MNEITEGRFSVSVEEGLHLSLPLAGSDAFQHGLVLDDTPFLRPRACLEDGSDSI